MDRYVRIGWCFGRMDALCTQVGSQTVRDMPPGSEKDEAMAHIRDEIALGMGLPMPRKEVQRRITEAIRLRDGAN